MKIAIYARRSEEKETGESIKSQLSICKKYIDLRYDKCIVDEYYDDDYSGKNTHRPNFERMMHLIKSGEYNCLAFWKLDRVSRNALDFLTLQKELEKINVNMISVTEGFDPSTVTGKLMMTILISVAEMERKNISIRVSTFMNESAKRGRWLGGNAPFGYTSEKILESGIEVTYLMQNKITINIAKDIFKKYLSCYSFHAVSRMLKEKYNVIKTPTDIRKMLQNPVYVNSSELIKKWFKNQGVEVYGEINGNGFISYGKEDWTSEDGKKKYRTKNDWIIAVGKHEGIISDIDYINIHDRIKNNKRGRTGTGDNTYLNPLVHCAYCGSYMRVKTMKCNNTTYKYFECIKKTTNSKACENKMIKVDKLENEVLNKLENIYSHKDKFLNNINESNEDDSNLIALKKESENLNKQIKNLVKKTALNDDLEDVFMDEIRSLKQVLIDTNNRILILEKEKTLKLNSKVSKEEVFNELKDIRKTIESCKDIESKREAIRHCVENVKVDNINKKVYVYLCI
jgi:DNA invertase Pin-like site-specific DNA recombinase